MLDIIAGIYVGALCATVVGVLVGLSPLSTAAKLALCSAAGAWLAIIVAVAAFGWLTPGTFRPIPATLLPFTLLLALLFGSWFLVQAFRSAVLSLPLPALVGVHAGRLGGILFLLFHADGRLSAPFAPAAAVGDMATGAVAIALAAMLALGLSVGRTWLAVWNALGALDLAAAVSLGTLSMPGTPFRIFTEEPGTLLMTTVPGIVVPGMLVPIFLFAHFAIAARLRTTAEIGRVGGRLANQGPAMHDHKLQKANATDRGRNEGSVAGVSRGIAFARTYDLLLRIMTRGREQQYREDLLDLAGVAPDQCVLDIGCGTGTQAVAIHRRVQPGGSVMGVDVSENMLAAAVRKARRAGVDISFRLADAMRLPFEDGSFDARADAGSASAKQHASSNLAAGCC